MAWKVTSAVNERLKFVLAVERGEQNVAALCREFGISRKTGYKYLARYARWGAQGLEDLSRAPGDHPNATPDDIVAAVLAARRGHPTWGPEKLLVVLERSWPEVVWPASSTVAEILHRHGLSAVRVRHRHVAPNTDPLRHCQWPNDVWCADFKGWFRTGDGQRCDPLTITDGRTRFLLECRAVAATGEEHVRPVFKQAFQAFGLPRAIRTDNGPPFATLGLAGLSRLSVWWIKLGIIPERIEPGHPEQNGRHERMHLTLKQDTANPPRATLLAQQRRFDVFRREFNEERPHEALDMSTPASRYCPSGRCYPARVPPLEYPTNMEVRGVRSNGALKWHGAEIFVTEVLGGEPVGLLQIHDRYWELHVGPFKVGVLDAHRHEVLTLQRWRTRQKRSRLELCRGSGAQNQGK